MWYLYNIYIWKSLKSEHKSNWYIVYRSKISKYENISIDFKLVSKHLYIGT